MHYFFSNLHTNIVTPYNVKSQAMSYPITRPAHSSLPNYSSNTRGSRFGSLFKHMSLVNLRGLASTLKSN